MAFDGAALCRERRGHIVAPVLTWELDVDATGAASGNVGIGSVIRPRELPDSFYHEWLSQWNSHFYPVFLAISFLHCKNVQVERQAPPRKLSRAFERRHGRPLVRFHTLQITPMKQILEREGHAGTLGLKKALHICRGHFKTFTPDRKLFGRHTGTYWWNAHVRGTAEQGLSLKDYAVNRPAASSASLSVSTQPGFPNGSDFTDD